MDDNQSNENIYEKYPLIATEKWWDYIDVFKTNENMRTYLLINNLNGYTKFILEHPELFDEKAIDLFFEFYGSKLTDSYTYYYTLRILELILQDDPANFTLFDKEYFDEQFIRKAYSINIKIEDYLTTWQKKVYLYDDIIARGVRALIKSYLLLRLYFKDH